jgi:hypothetical protein
MYRIMKNLTFVGLLACLACSFSAPQDSAPESMQAAPKTSVLRLRSGAILWGHVVEHSAEKLSFKRIDTGGVVNLPWSFLDPEEEAGLRLALGYVELGSEELLVPAELFTLLDGSERMGIIEARDKDFIWIKNAGGSQPVPVQNFRGAPVRVQAPALEIYTRQELFLAKKAELGSGLEAEGRAGAEANDALAQYCERLFDFAHALQHYEFVERLDENYEPERINQALARAKEKAGHQEQLDILSSIDLDSARKRFGRAIAALILFEESCPETPLREDWLKLKERVEKAQHAAVVEQVRRSVHSWTDRLTRAAVREHKTYAAVLSYLEDNMQEAIFEAVRLDLVKLAPEIDEATIKAIWAQRGFGRARPATYGVGTWLLGKERAERTYKKKGDEEDKLKLEKKVDARKQLEERLEKFIKNQKITRRAQGGGSQSDEDEQEDFWKSWEYAGRRNWVRSYFIEDSELFTISSVNYSRCKTCGGLGAVSNHNLGGGGKDNVGGTVQSPCPVCKTLGVIRKFRYR